MNDLATIPDLMAEYLRRVNAYTDEVTYYGPNSWSFATARATAEMVADNGERLYRGLIRRHTLIGASGDALTEVLEEHGTPRLGPARARAFVILRPYVTTITAVSGGLIEVDDASHFEAGSSIRVATDDGAQSEIATVVAITEGTGPNGGDELDVGALVERRRGAPAWHDLRWDHPDQHQRRAVRDAGGDHGGRRQPGHAGREHVPGAR